MARVLSWTFVFDPRVVSDQELLHSKEVYDLVDLGKHHKTLFSFSLPRETPLPPHLHLKIFISSPFHSISSLEA